MAHSEIVLCDTNILIEFYKNNLAIINQLRGIGQDSIAISSVTVGELIYGAINKKELTQLNNDFTHLKVFHVNEAVSELAISLMTQFSLSHNLKLPDALIAATCLHHQLSLFTLNLKDFKYIPELLLFQRSN